MDIEKIIAEKKKLQNDIEAQLNEFQEKYNIDLTINISELSALRLGDNFTYKELSLKVEV